MLFLADCSEGAPFLVLKLIVFYVPPLPLVCILVSGAFWCLLPAGVRVKGFLPPGDQVLLLGPSPGRFVTHKFYLTHFPSLLYSIFAEGCVPPGLILFCAKRYIPLLALSSVTCTFDVLSDHRRFFLPIQCFCRKSFKFLIWWPGLY